ncbi:MAG: hypothetical protein ACP5NW_05220 [Candidatus Woesearchaeota archaeon]
MIKLKNRFLDAFLKLVLFSAGTHIVLIVIYSIIHLDFLPFNYFNIIDLDLFFPGIGNSALSNILSIACMIIIYLMIYFNLTGKTKIGTKIKD